MAFKAFYADIGPQPHHLPLVAAAGMNFLEADYITELNLCNHLHSLFPSHRPNKAKLRYNQLGTAKTNPTASSSLMACSSLIERSNGPSYFVGTARIMTTPTTSNKTRIRIHLVVIMQSLRRYSYLGG